jgi:pilus assembly protein Flp/PilA
MKALRVFLASEDGLAVTEYGLLLALVAVAVVAVIKLFGTQLSQSFSDSSAKVATP